MDTTRPACVVYLDTRPWIPLGRIRSNQVSIFLNEWKLLFTFLICTCFAIRFLFVCLHTLHRGTNSLLPCAALTPCHSFLPLSSCLRTPLPRPAHTFPPTDLSVVPLISTLILPTMDLLLPPSRPYPSVNRPSTYALLHHYPSATNSAPQPSSCPDKDPTLMPSTDDFHLPDEHLTCSYIFHLPFTSSPPDPS